jgi:hypothetical protein
MENLGSKYYWLIILLASLFLQSCTEVSRKNHNEWDYYDSHTHNGKKIPLSYLDHHGHVIHYGTLDRRTQ